MSRGFDVVADHPEQPVRSIEGGQREADVAGRARRADVDAVDDRIATGTGESGDRVGQNVELQVADDVDGRQFITP
ncbi:hypothetical protein [Streptomyces sp. SID13031]|uniref:hypothetical protein n=1 Tax=Streptomyces sp. SID13031 TaxID=2706046 RepID=UPI001EF2435B|nr:hypothetical protein [Streptomyces sp. SID13031]